MMGTETAPAWAPAGHTALVAAGENWVDLSFNFFYDWKWEAAIASVVVLCTAGIFMLGRTRMAGALMIIGGLFLGGVFANIEHFIHITQNTEQRWEQPNSHGNPFRRG